MTTSPLANEIARALHRPEQAALIDAKLAVVKDAINALLNADHQEHFCTRLNDSEMRGIEALKAALASLEPTPLASQETP